MGELFKSLNPHDLLTEQDYTPTSFSPGTDETLTPGQLRRMQQEDWANLTSQLQKRSLIHMFDERCEKIQVIIGNIAKKFPYSRALIGKIQCCRMYDQTYQKIDGITLEKELTKFKSSKNFLEVKRLIQAEINKTNTHNIASRFKGEAPTANPIATQESNDCCSENGTNSCNNVCYIGQRVPARVYAKLFLANTSKCERRYGNIEHVGKYTKGLDKSGKPKVRTVACLNQDKDYPQPKPNDILTQEELQRYEINIKSGGRTPSAPPSSLSTSKADNKADNKADSEADSNTLLKIVINYLLFICKMLTYHKYLIIRTSENDFKKLIKKPRKQKLYTDLSNKLDELNTILDEVAGAASKASATSEGAQSKGAQSKAAAKSKGSAKSKGGASYTRKKQRRRSRRRSRRTSRRRSHKKVLRKKSTRKKR